MTETQLPEELEEQAMLHALGILNPDDRQAFLVKLQGESELLHQTVIAYQATTEALAAAVVPITPPPALRERLVSHIALEGIRDAEQFELAASTLGFTAAPVTPRDSVRERLMSRIEEHAKVRLKVNESLHSSVEISASNDGGVGSQGQTDLSGVSIDTPSSRFAHAWRHLFVTSYVSLRLCWKALANLLRTMFMSSAVTHRSRVTKARQAFQGLRFIKAMEGTWREIAPGVTAKVLSFDLVSRRATTLLRFAPGTRYAPHRHTETEELYVLQGGCSIAGREMTVGDYHRAESGTEHYDTSTDEGCLLLVVSSPQNEILH